MKSLPGAPFRLYWSSALRPNQEILTTVKDDKNMHQDGQRSEEFNLGPGEVRAFRVPAPEASLDDPMIEVQLTGRCGCGGQLKRRGQKLEWICENSHFWNRSKHAHLKGEIQGEIEEENGPISQE